MVDKKRQTLVQENLEATNNLSSIVMKSLYLWLDEHKTNGDLLDRKRILKILRCSRVTMIKNALNFPKSNNVDRSLSPKRLDRTWMLDQMLYVKSATVGSIAALKTTDEFGEVGIDASTCTTFQDMPERMHLELSVIFNNPADENSVAANTGEQSSLTAPKFFYKSNAIENRKIEQTTYFNTNLIYSYEWTFKRIEFENMAPNFVSFDLDLPNNYVHVHTTIYVKNSRNVLDVCNKSLLMNENLGENNFSVLVEYEGIKHSSIFCKFQERHFVNSEELEGLRNSIFSNFQSNILLLDFMLSPPLHEICVDFAAKEISKENRKFDINMLKEQLKMNYRTALVQHHLYDECWNVIESDTSSFSDDLAKEDIISKRKRNYSTKKP